MLEAACRARAYEGREYVVRGCMGIYNIYICVAVMIYLVSFVPNLPLLSRNSNFTLMEREGTHAGRWMRYRQKEREMKNIRANGSFLFGQSHSASSTDITNYGSVHCEHTDTVNLVHCICQDLHLMSICHMKCTHE